MSEWDAARQCLHDEDGTLGLYWVRAAPQAGIVSTLAASLGGDLGTARGLLPPLGAEDTPMTWVDANTGSAGFKPFKHRKFIEKLEGDSTAILPTLRLAHDARVPLSSPCAEWDQAVAKATGSHTFTLDLHCFHTTVVPQKPKVPARKQA